MELPGEPRAGAAGLGDRRRQPRLCSSHPNTRRARGMAARRCWPRCFRTTASRRCSAVRDVGAAFAALPFDHLLFTGSTAVGRKVMAAAAHEPDAGDARTRRQVAGDRRAGFPAGPAAAIASRPESGSTPGRPASRRITCWSTRARSRCVRRRDCARNCARATRDLAANADDYTRIINDGAVRAAGALSRRGARARAR